MSSTSAASRPGSVRLRQAVALTVASVLALVMLVLGVWQMSVYRNQGRDSLITRSQRPPVSLAQSLDGGMPIGDLYGLPVTLQGHYLSLPSVVVGTTPPYRVVSAFDDHSRIVPVVRGTVDSLSATVPAPPAGSVTQSGILLPSETDATGGAPAGAPTGWLNGVRIERLAQGWPAGVTAGFVTLDAGGAAQNGLEVAGVTFPSDASGHAQNLGYAIQWWVFAIFAVVMGVVIARSLGRRAAESADPGTTDATE